LGKLQPEEHTLCIVGIIARRVQILGKGGKLVFIVLAYRMCFRRENLQDPSPRFGTSISRELIIRRMTDFARTNIAEKHGIVVAGFMAQKGQN